MPSVPVLETPRLLLRGYKLEDFEPFAAMRADPTVYRFIGGSPISGEDAWRLFLQRPGHWHLRGFGFFAIANKLTGVFIGEGGFHDMNRSLEPSISGTMEIGYSLAPAAQGQGIAEEAMRAALAWADQHGTGDRYTCMIDPEHAASIRIATKLGFIRFAETEYHGKPVVLLEKTRPQA